MRGRESHPYDASRCGIGSFLAIAHAARSGSLIKQAPYRHYRKVPMEGNLFAHLPCLGEAEQFVELLSRPGLKIERIVSRAHASPPDFWYEQPHAEWVLVVAGQAGLRFEDEGRVRILGRGDFVDIVPHRRHRVDWTDASGPTIWLAVHYGEGLRIEMEPKTVVQSGKDARSIK